MNTEASHNCHLTNTTLSEHHNLPLWVERWRGGEEKQKTANKHRSLTCVKHLTSVECLSPS